MNEHKQFRFISIDESNTKVLEEPAVLETARQLRHGEISVWVTQRVMDMTLPHAEKAVDELQQSVIRLAGGNPIAYSNRKEMGGFHETVIQEITPMNSIKRSLKELRGHTDMCYLLFPHEDAKQVNSPTNGPDYLSLMCHHNEEKVSTTFHHVDDLVEALTKSEIQELCKYQYQPFDRGGMALSGSLSILSPHPERGWQIRFSDSDKFRCETKAGREALDQLYKAVDNNPKIQRVCLKQGDLMIFDNRRVVHGRDAIEKPLPSGMKRLLKRVYAVRRDVELVNNQEEHKHILNA